MEIDRAVFEAYGKIGPGFEKPLPRASVEPFGHRFMPAMYGCHLEYAPDADPSGKPRILGVRAALVCEIASCRSSWSKHLTSGRMLMKWLW